MPPGPAAPPTQGGIGSIKADVIVETRMDEIELERLRGETGEALAELRGLVAQLRETMQLGFQGLRAEMGAFSAALERREQHCQACRADILGQMREINSSTQRQVDDHESRLRFLERGYWRLATVSAAIGAVAYGIFSLLRPLVERIF